ncbi:YybH family protein [Paludisphaera mucosa]|uniref:SgcJ/EcaC family oxidoreductase n=1 Tax=Paludisphaera mucosa TaxID=3030827 RepID=A0ABT6FFR8_9BACT|nr:SgcJ/EcaC family oxidoreductase [Paludisphaera mucosa]MDG3006421.1 SgcJ/EcaC family oxidoreductase [Paludisphaera mucosa]
MRSDEQAIREVHSIWIDGINAGDLTRLLPMTTDDVVLIIPGEVCIGRDGFAAKSSGAHEELLIHCVSELKEVVVVGEVAYTRSRDSLTVSPRAGGEESRLAGDRLTIYRKQPDGRWLLARDANTVSPVVEP